MAGWGWKSRCTNTSSDVLSWSTASLATHLWEPQWEFQKSQREAEFRRITHCLMMDNKLAVAGMVGGIVGGLVGAVAVTLATRGNILYRSPSCLSFISCSSSFKTGATFYTDHSIYIACPPSFSKILIRTTGHLGHQRQLFIQITFSFIIYFLLVDCHSKQGGGRASVGCTRETHEAAES